MSKKVSVVIPDELHAHLTAVSERTSVTMSELIRRPVVREYPLEKVRRTTGIEISFAVWRRRIFGRRPGVAFDP